MLIKDCMKRNIIVIKEKNTIHEAAALIVENHIGILPVVGDQGKPVGVVRLNNLLSLELPDFVNLVEDFDFVHDFGAVETTRPAHRTLEKPVTTIMEPILTIEEGCGLLRAYAIMLRSNTYDLPVTTASGELTGIVSRADIAAAILGQWAQE